MVFFHETSDNQHKSHSSKLANILFVNITRFDYERQGITAPLSDSGISKAEATAEEKIAVHKRGKSRITRFYFEFEFFVVDSYSVPLFRPLVPFVTVTQS